MAYLPSALRGVSSNAFGFVKVRGIKLVVCYIINEDHTLIMPLSEVGLSCAPFLHAGRALLSLGDLFLGSVGGHFGKLDGSDWYQSAQRGF